MKKILIISHDKVGPTMAGPGIRYHKIAELLSKYHDVTLATFNPEYLEGLRDVTYKFTDIKVFDFKPEFEKHDIILALWLSEEMIEFAKNKRKILIFDLYAPVPVENLVGQIFSKNKIKPEDDYNYLVSIKHYKKFLSSGDLFLTSNPIQRDFWTGYSLATEKVVPSSYLDFPIHDRIVVCPMGIDIEETHKLTNSDPIRQRFTNIKKSDYVIVWTGGIWDWFDAVTPIKAIKKLVDEGLTDVKLVFLGTKHPNKDVPDMGETEKAMKLSEKFNLIDKNVFFMSGWIEYAKRLEYLNSANIALYAHKPSIEARYSHRTRVLDHILAGLPTIATRGDYFAELIEANGLGIVVETENSNEMANAIKNLINRKSLDEIKVNINNVKNDFTWKLTLKELIEFTNSEINPRKIINLVPVFENSKKSKILVKIKHAVPRTMKEKAKRILVKLKQ